MANYTITTLWQPSSVLPKTKYVNIKVSRIVILYPDDQGLGTKTKQKKYAEF